MYTSVQRCKKNVTCNELISPLWKKQNPYSKKPQTEILPLHNCPNIHWPPWPRRPWLGRLADWYAERRACYASEDAGARLKALEGIPSQILAEAVQLPLPTTDARFEGLQTSLGNTRSLKFQWNDWTIGHLEFDERELIIYIILYSKKNVEDFKFGIRS